MTDSFLFIESFKFLILTWLLISFWGFYINIYRCVIDRVRAGISPSPEDIETNRLIDSLLAAPNHERPYHIESALLSSIQIILGTISIQSIYDKFIFNSSVNQLFIFIIAFSLAFLLERIWTRIASSSSSEESSMLSFHLKVGKPLMLFVHILCVPFSIILKQLEGLMLKSPKPKNKEKTELADHIRTLSRESSTLDPEVFEIVGNTLEMGHLHVRDVLVPRNQVQILNCEDGTENNLKIIRECGHTRIPICEGDLDHCIGIIHVKYAFRLLSQGRSIDLRKLSKSPAILSTEDPLPVALRKMMKWKIHMALVEDEFGGIDGVITLEDILEEVVGEIQDEFDSEEDTVKKSGRNKWRISGLSPIHELPKEFTVDSNEEMSSFGGLVTKELGRIPEIGESLRIKNMFIKILEADETRVLLTEVSILQETIIEKEN